jgi:hypothetical protein
MPVNELSSTLIELTEIAFVKIIFFKDVAYDDALPAIKHDAASVHRAGFVGKRTLPF